MLIATSRVLTISAAEAKRSSGSFAIAFIMTRSMGSGKSGAFSLGRSSAQEGNDNSYYAIIIEKIKYIIYAILQI